MKNEIKTPPPFVRCGCDNGWVYRSYGGTSKDLNIGYDRIECKKCNGTGWLPQWYTPEQWVEYVRRENNLPDYEIPDDIPIYDGIIFNKVIEWHLTTYKKTREFPEKFDNGERFRHYVIATDAGRPPEGYKP